MDNTEILSRAQELFINQKYPQARALLEVLDDDPTALKWIAKIDEIAARHQIGSQTAFTPTQLVSSDQSPFVTEKRKRSPIRRALRELILLIIGFLVLAIWSARGDYLKYDVLGLFNIKNTYQDNRILVTHPSNWEATTLTRHGWCKDNTSNPETTCLLYLKRYPDNDKGILFVHVAMDDVYSAKEFIDFNWEDNIDDPTFDQLNRRLQNVTIAGTPAVAQFYRQLENDDNGGNFYMIDIYLTDTLDGYVINVFATNQCELAESIGEVNEILSTLQVAGTSPSEDGYTAASPVNLEIEGCD